MVDELASSDEFYFQWHLTERCNKRCSHCYQDDNGKNELPLSELEHILRIMEDALIKWDRIGSLSLTGGGIAAPGQRDGNDHSAMGAGEPVIARRPLSAHPRDRADTHRGPPDAGD